MIHSFGSGLGQYVDARGQFVQAHTRGDQVNFEVGRQGALVHEGRFLGGDLFCRDRQRQLRIIGYERGKRGYRRMPLDSQGRLWLETVQLWLGQENGRVVCYDSDRFELDFQRPMSANAASPGTKATFSASARASRSVVSM